MTSTQTPTRTHSVILRLGERYCSLPVECVREMTVLPEIKELCGTQDYVPGVITLRGAAIPVVDLRMRLGMGDIMDENKGIIATLKEREKDHLNWISELEASVREERPFTLGTDPTQCAFGRWMGTFEPKTRELGHLLHGFEAPHGSIHGVAQRVTHMASLGDLDGALQMIESTRTTDLRFMIEQFKRVFSLLSDRPRQIAIVIEVDDESVGIIVDEVASLAWVKREEGDISREAASIDGLFACMGRSETDARMVSMLSPRALRVHKAA
jgi:purine-binding chemotaxis protein CheW